MKIPRSRAPDLGRILTMESAGFLVVSAVFKTVVALRERGEVGSIPTLSVHAWSVAVSSIFLSRIIPVVLLTVDQPPVAEKP